jgi:hypothetical protein
MTTSKGAGIPVQRPAAEAEAAGSELSPQATANADRAETTPLTGRITAPADDSQRLVAEIERTREYLGEIVQELAARVDVKTRARAKGAEVSGRMKSAAVQVRNRAAAVGAPVWEATPEQVRRAVTQGANSARDHWMPLGLAAGALIVGYLAVRQWNR